jgi:chorismate lyase/3-hydroxybenzoate synthase
MEVSHLHWALGPEDLRLPTQPDHILGGAWLGPERPGSSPAWPEQVLCSALPVGPTHGLRELWWCAGGDEPREGVAEGLVWRRIGDLLFGVLTVEESPSVDPADGTPLQAAARQAYRTLFDLLDAQGLRHIWRLWNYMADINRETHGLERYRQFNIGRAQAFEACSRSLEGQVPAACALGLAGGPLSVAFLAGSSPVRSIENPRQVSAFHYPSQYGPRSPTFSRAALARLPGQQVLMVSGTASIVGHQTVHAGDVRAQTLESLNNVAAVLEAASRADPGARFSPADLIYRVYCRHDSDAAMVREVVRTFSADAPAVYLRADVCRSDLLVEIEALGTRPHP